MDPSGLEILWFAVVAIFWTGFFVLEGFDLGVGILQRALGRTDTEQRVAINAIGPFWDGNEVWLIVAGAAMFAAFPAWYATMFSGMYLALVLVLVCLILRGVSFEYRGKVAAPRWSQGWSWALAITSTLLPVLFGVALGDLLVGLPINEEGNFTGNFFDLLTPYGIWVGVTLLALTLLHGSTFLMLKTTGTVHDRARRVSGPFALASIVTVAVFAIWTQSIADQGLIPGPLQVVGVLAILAGGWAVRDGHEGWTFVATSIAMATTVVSIFIQLYPNVMVSSTDDAYSLTIAGAASGSYALTVMTVVAVIFFPIVLLYQGWSYYRFRERIRGPRSSPPEPAPVTVISATLNQPTESPK